MSGRSPAAILYDENGNPVGVTLDGAVYRLQAVTKVLNSGGTQIDPATESTVAAINAKLVSGTDIGDVTINNTAGAGAVNVQDGGNSITVDAVSLPLPTGAATESTLNSINTKTPVLGQTTMAASLPVVIASNQSAIPITDNAGSLTVDGTVGISGSVAVTGPLTDTQLRATPVPVSDGGGSITVDGSVSISGTPTFVLDSEGVINTTTPTSAILIGGNDGTNIRDVQVRIDNPTWNDLGLIVRNIEAQFATFTAIATSIAPANNKHMLSLFNNTGSSVILRVREIYIMNVQTTSVTGVMGTFSIQRTTAQSAGTTVTPTKHDTAQALNGSVLCATGATVTVGSVIKRYITSTDEYGPGTLDQEGYDKETQSRFPIWATGPQQKPITLRATQGVTVQFVTNSTAGAFDIVIVFTQE